MFCLPIVSGCSPCLFVCCLVFVSCLPFVSGYSCCLFVVWCLFLVCLLCLVVVVVCLLVACYQGFKVHGFLHLPIKYPMMNDAIPAQRVMIKNTVPWFIVCTP